MADYFSMLASEWTGKPFNKAEHNRALHALTGSSHGAVERKHQNTSAVLSGMGIPWIDGYKPPGHRRDRSKLSSELSWRDTVDHPHDQVLHPLEPAWLARR